MSNASPCTYNVAPVMVATIVVETEEQSRLCFCFGRTGNLFTPGAHGELTQVDILDISVITDEIPTVSVVLTPLDANFPPKKGANDIRSADGHEATVDAAGQETYTDIQFAVPFVGEALYRRTRYWEFNPGGAQATPDRPGASLTGTAPVPLKIKVKVTRIDSQRDIKNSPP